MFIADTQNAITTILGVGGVGLGVSVVETWILYAVVFQGCSLSAGGGLSPEQSGARWCRYSVNTNGVRVQLLIESD